MDLSSCSKAYRLLAEELTGPDCAQMDTLFRVRAPWALTGWTLPAVEWLFIAAGVATLVHALKWLRQRDDPTYLALWLANIVYVIVLEPPLYFPAAFGIEERVGLIFAHNVFSVQLLYERLPLYIVMLYPALTYVAFLIVARAGVFERRGTLIGSACVAAVYHGFYEIFDQIGPALRWWAWHPAAPSNNLLLASVPWTSIALFACASPFSVALLTKWLLSPRTPDKTLSIKKALLRSVVVGALAPIGMCVLAVPYQVVGLGFGKGPAWQVAVLALQVLGFCLIAVWALWDSRRQALYTGHARSGSAFLDDFEQWAGWLYLAVFAVLWLAALPAHLAATNGVTPNGAAAGSVAYASGCFAGMTALLVLTRWRRSLKPNALVPLEG